jgi:ParB family chromosome partitioning protein
MHALTEPAPHDDNQPAPPAADPAGPAGSAGQPAPPDARARRMIPVSDLAAHPGNVREDLNLTGEFTASVASEGVRVPLLITPAPDGGWRVIEGHRRLAAAVRAGLGEVPCDVDPARAGDEAGQYLDMALANSDAYRVNYQPAEEAAALFAAHEAGASRTRIRKATGRTAAQVKTALAAGGLPAETRMLALQRNSELTLDELALLAEFGDDEQATETLLSCLDRGWPLEHAAERIRQDRAAKAERDQLRTTLLAAGVPLTGRLPEGADWLTSLTHDGQEITPESHGSCPGHGAAFDDWNPLHPMFYCTTPAGHGHASRWAASLSAGSHNDSRDDSDGTSPGAGTQPEPAPDPGRRLVIEGNKAWQAASQVRHRWLTSSLLARRSLPRDAHAFAARQLLAMPGPLASGLTSARRDPLFARLTGHDPDHLQAECGTATTGRLTVIMLAPVITAYEHAMTDGEGRNTWRTDRYSPCPRADAGTYLRFLAGLGYQLSGIEQAVADGTPWTGDTPPDSLLADPGNDDASHDDAGDEPPGSADDPDREDSADSPADASPADGGHAEAA